MLSRFAALRILFASLLALALVASGMATAAMVVEHEASTATPLDHGHAHAQSAQATDHDGCPPSDGKNGGLCCGHPVCMAGWNLAAASAPLTLPASDDRQVIHPARGLAASPHFPTLKPPKA